MLVTSYHYFLGVNSPQGFFSRFETITEDTAIERKIYIKGGPGTGKSTLMKRLINRAESEGIGCEIFHCASDPVSVDGVYIPDRNVAVLDATAPHNFDPAFPGIYGEIFDVSKHIKKEALSFHPSTLKEQVHKKRRAFQKGYKYLSAALPIIRLIEMEQMENLDVRGVYKKADSVFEFLFGRQEKKDLGSSKSLFLSAITPDGVVNFKEYLANDAHCFTIQGGLSAIVFLSHFACLARMKGYKTVSFYCPMRPDSKCEHLYFPSEGIFLTTKDSGDFTSFGENIDLSAFENPLQEECLYRKEADRLIKKATEAFSVARSTHINLEAIYRPAMDFSALEEETGHLIDTIF